MTAKDRFDAALNWLSSQYNPHAALARDQLCQVEMLRDALIERDSEVHQLREQNTELLQLLRAIGAVADVVGRAARQEVAAGVPIEAAVDNTSFRNLMATMYGLGPVGEPLPEKRKRKAKQ